MLAAWRGLSVMSDWWDTEIRRWLQYRADRSSKAITEINAAQGPLFRSLVDIELAHYTVYQELKADCRSIESFMRTLKALPERASELCDRVHPHDSQRFCDELRAFSIVVLE